MFSKLSGRNHSQILNPYYVFQTAIYEYDMLQPFPDTLNLETNMYEKVEFNLQTSHQSTVEKENI